ncbi:ribonuclease III [Syntrophobotulus glycolicus DSM 8271]|uniref:Mini-ribonuclease 3 n=1 Tax=Syntrophobotulus glycolicus (strain DSM 8271 / FlGlyR) TaxID=645991 RepID=F0SXC5_SYNGF|nr:ribonuclease III domain-containing protein [Syntrophobotulus glycolicus]ADY54671.1 ribonuclease III [Syntrophobotulus glycolicus DSM 8271]
MVSQIDQNSSPLTIKWQEVNILTLAYLGDAVYELWVRSHLLTKGIAKVEDLHKAAVHYVQARFQASLLKLILPELDETETGVVKRGRNAKGHHPRNIDVVTYRHATAFEALVGYWYLAGCEERMQGIFSRIDDLTVQIDSEQ